MNLDKKFFVASFLFHVLVIFVFLFVSGDNKLNKSFLVYGVHSKKPTKAYFKPLRAIKRESESSSVNISKVASNVASKSKVASKKVVPNKTVVPSSSKKNPPRKLADKKSAPKKIEPPKVSKKTEPKKQIQPVKKDVSAKLQVKREEEKKQKEIQPEIKERGIIKEEVVAEQKEDPIEEEVLNFNLMGSADSQLYVYQRHIQKEVERVWHPPIGVPKGTECSLTFVIDSCGDVKSFEFVKKSSILLYDLSIIKVAKKFKFDECLWGRRFNIVFRQ